MHPPAAIAKTIPMTAHTNSSVSTSLKNVHRPVPTEELVTIEVPTVIKVKKTSDKATIVEIESEEERWYEEDIVVYKKQKEIRPVIEKQIHRMRVATTSEKEKVIYSPQTEKVVRYLELIQDDVGRWEIGKDVPVKVVKEPIEMEETVMVGKTIILHNVEVEEKDVELEITVMKEIEVDIPTIERVKRPIKLTKAVITPEENIYTVTQLSSKEISVKTTKNVPYRLVAKIHQPNDD